MKLVIDINDRTYEMIKDRLFFAGGVRGSTMKYNALTAIYNGKPLPKGHGRLGDLDALQKEVSSWGMNDYEPSDFIDEINNADTIIEADKTERRDQE